MASNIKGITIQFNGETTKLDKALKDIRDNTKALDKELKGVDNALKFNPTNVDLWRQKQELLTQKVGETEKKLQALKDAQSQMDAKGVDKNTAEYRSLERQIIVTENQVKTFRGQLNQVGNYKLTALSEEFKQAGSKLEGVGQSLKGVSIAAAGVVTGLGAIAVKAGTAADDLNTLSKVTGIGTKDLQKYGYAADLVDVSTEAIAKSQKKLTKQLYQVGVYAKGPAEEFETLGVAVTDANGELRNSEDVFADVLKALGEMTNETERDAIAQTLFGKSAAELNPLIEDGGKTYKMVADTMKKYNLDYVDQATLDKANEFNDQLDTMKLLGSVAFAQVGSQLAAHLAPALEKVVDLVGKFADWLSKLSPETLTVVAAIASFVAVLAPLLIGIGKLATGIGAIIKLAGIVGPAISGLSLGPMAGIVLAIGAVIAIGVILYKNWDKIKAVAIAVGAKIKEVWNSIKTSVSNAAQAVGNKVSSVWESIKTKTSAAWNWIKEKITTPFRVAKETIASVADSIKIKIGGAWDTIKEKTGNAWKSIRDKIVAPFTWAKDKIDAIVEKIKGWFPIQLGDLFSGIKLPHFDIEWSSIKFGNTTIDFPSGFDINWYKNGGIFSSPSVIGVGEAGNEAVVPLDKFWDKLDNLAQPPAAPVINIYAREGQSAREIAKEVERVLVQQQKQRASAYGTI